MAETETNTCFGSQTLAETSKFESVLLLFTTAKTGKELVLTLRIVFGTVAKG